MKLQACKGTPDLTVPNRVADVSLDFPTGSQRSPLNSNSTPFLSSRDPVIRRLPPLRFHDASAGVRPSGDSRMSRRRRWFPPGGRGQAIWLQRRDSGNQSGALVLPHGSSDDLNRAFEGAVGRELLSNGTGE
jgi:hypothetical protein